jgi:hypothetical protein
VAGSTQLLSRAQTAPPSLFADVLCGEHVAAAPSQVMFNIPD